MEQHELVNKPLLTVSGKPSFNTQTTETPMLKSEQPHVTESRSVARKSSRISALWPHGWTAETCACVLALCALVGLVVVLLRLQNRPLPDWPHAVTVNSIVSIFALLIRASVGLVLAEGISQSKWQWFRRPRKLVDMERFDAASRGAWGSILLLFSRRRLSWIAALGSVITIVAALLGFFAQQLVQFQDCPRQTPNALVGISTTHVYNASGPPIANMVADMYPPMIAAINNGIIQSESAPNYDSVISHNCNSGNCTFPSDDGASYSTLGVSHSCEDVTPQVIEARFPNDPTNTTIAYLNTTTRGNVSLGFPGPTAFSTGSMGSSYGNNTLVTVKMIYKASSQATNYSAISCVLFPTVKTYSVNITKSIMHEQVISERRVGGNIFAYTNDSYIRFKLATSTTLRNGRNTTCQRRSSPAPGFSKVAQDNVDLAPSSLRNLTADAATTWYYPSDCVYSLSKFSIDGIEAYFSEIFDDGKLVWASRLGGNTGSIYLRQFFQSGNMTLRSVDAIFANVATAMSVTIRTNGAEGADGYAKGVMWYNTTCMRVKWAWIAFPAGLIGLSIVFLALVAIESRGTESDRLWKSSVLATLFCDVGQVDEHGVKPEGKKAMGDIACSTSVSLGGGDGVLRLASR